MAVDVLAVKKSDLAKKILVSNLKAIAELTESYRDDCVNIYYHMMDYYDDLAPQDQKDYEEALAVVTCLINAMENSRDILGGRDVINTTMQ